jgi:hypothetical protein
VHQTLKSAKPDRNMQRYQQVKIQCIEFFGELFAQYSARIPDLLTEQIASADSDRQRNRYLDARNAFAETDKQIEQDYKKALGRFFDEAIDQGEPADNSTAQLSPLSLVDKAQYEDDVAARALASRIAAANAEELWKLNRRMAVLRGGKKFTDECNPCGPHHLCRAVQAALRSLDTDLLVKRFLYQAYQADVLSQVDQYYRQLNEELASQGILKNLGFALARNPAAAVGRAPTHCATPTQVEHQAAAPADHPPATPHPMRQPAANDPGATAAGPTGDNQLAPVVTPEMERRQARVVDAIRSVQRKRTESAQPRTRTASGADYGTMCCDGIEGGRDTFSARDIATALSRVQTGLQLPPKSRTEPGNVGETESKLLGELGQLDDTGKRQKITSLDADTIDLVGMLFDHMLDDPQLPANVKPLLSHLHTPYLKVALLDPGFFASATHPARRLLDLLAAVGVRWLQDGEDDDKVYQRIRHLVERILNEFKDDILFFEELLNDLTRFVRLLEKRATLAERRCRETEKGLDQLNQSKAVAGQEINTRIHGIALNALVRQLLAISWVDYLVYLHLRHGAHSDAWRSALAVIDDIIATTSPRPAGTPKPTAAKREQLAESVGVGLQSIGCDEQRRAQLLNALRDAQSKATDSEALSAVTGSAARRLTSVARSPKAPQPSATIGDDTNLKPLSGREQALAERLSTIEFGSWFEFRMAGKQPRQRLKLSWYSSVSGNYMFVNAAGIKCAVKDLRTLVRGLNVGTIIIIDKESKNLFERAISSVLMRMKK